MPLSSLLIQEVETPLAVSLSISEYISVMCTTSLEVTPIQDFLVGSGAFAHALLTVKEADPSRKGNSKI